MSACTGTHTKYQPTEAEWKCPKCGAGPGDLCVDEGSGSDDCDLLHDEDYLVCYGVKGNGCDWDGTSGKAFAARIQKAKNLVPCACCKGTGLVPKDAR